MTAWSAGDRAIYHNAGRTDDPMEGEVILNGPHPLAEGRGWYIRNAQGSAGFAFLDELTPVTTPTVDLGIADTRALDAIAASVAAWRARPVDLRYNDDEVHRGAGAYMRLIARAIDQVRP